MLRDLLGNNFELHYEDENGSDVGNTNNTNIYDNANNNANTNTNTDSLVYIFRVCESRRGLGSLPNA